MIVRKLTLLLACSALGFACAPTQAGAGQGQVAPSKDEQSQKQAAPRPNVVLILLDDLGYGQLGFTGHPVIRTPNIDRLAAQGTIFTNGYAGGTVCSPSRISLMTGRDASRLSSAANDILLRPKDRTIAHVLGDAGYDTALFGKFGVGNRFGSTDPMTMGFGHWVGVLHNVEAHRQYPPFLYRDNEVQFVRANVAGAKGAYAQRLFTDAALSWLNTRTSDKPFFAYLSYTSPHSEMAAPEEFVAPYRGKFPETPYKGKAGPTPESQFPDYYPEAIDQPNAVQAGMIAALDAYIGEVLAKLDERGLAQNTIVILSSDNGNHAEGGGDIIGQMGRGPYRGGKRDLTEGGIHVPFVIRWPGAKRGETQSGIRNATPVHFADILPTLAELAGAPDVAQKIDSNGTSLAGLLTGKSSALPDRMLYWTFARQLGDPNSNVIGKIEQAGRMGQWKAMRADSESPIRLYDLSRDPGEKTDVAKKHPKIVAEFTRRFSERLDEQQRYR
jgi:arylsulfatase A